MTENVQTAQTIGYGTTSPAERNKVLRNTYWLLALSLIPTVLGAYIGVADRLYGAYRLYGRGFWFHLRD